MAGGDTYSIQDYGWMINDRIRTAPYVEALRRAVRPGSVVLDLGSGTGFFAFLACRFGAARVYAIEPDEAIEVARLCSADNPGSERITWLQCFSTAIDLPEKVDVLIGDLRGNLPFYTANIPSMIDARKRHLKPGGQIIPGRDVLRIGPASAPREHENLIAPWRKNDYGVDFSAGRKFVENSFWRAKSESIASDAMLAAPGTWGVIDYAQVESANLSGRLSWSLERGGPLHGFYVWFDVEVADGLGFSNSPDKPTLVYGRSFLPLPEAVEVSPGDRVDLSISATLVEEDYVYAWLTSVTSAKGESRAAFNQTTFKGRPIRLRDLKHAAADFVPTLTLEGEIDCAIMQGLARSQSLGSIAGELADHYPHRFATLKSALGHVARLSLKYAE